MSEPRVSVIVRTFNRPAMLDRALASVAAQTYGNREAVVVNDGGRDVEDVVLKYRSRGLDVIHLNFKAEEKPGRCLAATKGIEASTGEWIAYLDDDDFYFQGHLQALMDAARETGARCLYTDAMIGEEAPDGQGGYVITGTRPGPSNDFSRSGFYSDMYIHLVTFCHHRSVFDSLGGFDPELPVLEDLDLMFRYSSDHYFHHVKQVTAQFQIRSDASNAVTAMRREFDETRQLLCRRYLHLAVSDMMEYIDEGRARLIGLHDTIEALKARVAELEAKLKDKDGGSR